MGVVHWLKIQTTKGEEGGDRDLYALCRASQQLDVVCDAVGLRRLSSFTDEAGAQDAVADLLRDDDDDDEPSQRFGHDWHRVSEGLETVAALCEVLLSNDDALPTPEPPSLDHLLSGLPPDQVTMMRRIMTPAPAPVADIIDELAFVAHELFRRKSARFHFSLVS